MRNARRAGDSSETQEVARGHAPVCQHQQRGVGGVLLHPRYKLFAQKRDGLRIDRPEEAVLAARQREIRELAVQPLYLMHGLEHRRLMDFLHKEAAGFDRLSIGEPLLSEDADFRITAKAFKPSENDELGGSVMQRISEVIGQIKAQYQRVKPILGTQV